MSLSNNYPTQRPSLNLDFANGGDQLDSRISFSRADTPPTYAAPSAVHYWSNEKHLSSENLISQSADLGSWSEGSSSYTTVTSNATAAPDGTTTAAQITGLTGTNKKAIYHAISVGTGSYTGIFYVKPNGHEYAQIMFGGAAAIYQNYHLSGSGTLGNGTNDAASIDKMGDWYRITLTSNALSSATNFYVVMVDSNTAARYEDSASTSSIYAWGANFSSTGQKVFNSTTSQIHRSYSSTLKSVANAGDPRFEYDPITGNSEGLLIEAQSSNLVTYSENFGTWGDTNVVAEAGASVGPDGQPCYVMREDSSSGVSHYLSGNVSGQSTSTTYTMSVYAKKVATSNQTRYLRLRVNGIGGQASVEYDLSNGTVNRTTGTSLDSSSISSIGNGWYRLVMTYTNPSDSVASGMIISGSPDTTVTLPTYDGDGYSAFALFGASVEQSSSVSSYIKSNSGSSTTRSADSCSVVDATLFSSGEHTVIWEGDTDKCGDDPNLDKRFFSLSDTTTSNRLTVDYNDGTQVRLRNWADSNNDVAITYSADLTSGTHKVAATLKTNEAQLVVDGTRRQVDTSCVVGTGIQRLGVNTAFSDAYQQYNMNGHCKRITYFNVALSQTEVEALTS